MIRYTLKCSNAHRFESWFQSSDAFEKLAKSGFLSCNECGSSEIEKTLMAPNVSADHVQAPKSLSNPEGEAEKALAKMKAEVEKNSEYVGLNFASEARAIHEGESESRAIYGEAKPEEAKALIEEGVPVAPLPFIPKRSTN